MLTYPQLREMLTKAHFLCGAALAANDMEMYNKYDAIWMRIMGLALKRCLTH